MPTPAPTEIASLMKATTEILYTAREQAVFVALFIVLTLIILGFNLRAQASTQKMIKEFREFTKNRDDSWQTFLQKMANQQNEMITLLSSQFDARNNTLAEALESVKDGLVNLHNFIANSLRDMAEKRASSGQISKPRKGE